MRFFLLIVLFTFCSCASQIEVITPSSNFTLPEANGEFAKYALNINQSHGSLLAIKINETDGQVSSTTHTSTLGWGANLNYGLSKYIDFYTKVSTHSPHLFGFKVQLKGDPKFTAKRKNLSVAFNMGIGQNKYSGSGTENFGIQLSNAEYTLNRTHTAVEMGVSVGYRFITDLLTYTHIEQILENVHGQIKFDNNPSDNKNLDINGSHLQYTLGSMYEHHEYNWGFEFAIQQMNWDSSEKKNTSSFNLLFGKSY